MAIGNFRTAIGGFNRQDVANYIEYMNHQHAAEIAQLNTQLQNAQEALKDAQPGALKEKLDEALARCAELEARIHAMESNASPSEIELETYRRAERVERMAQERATKIHDQANAVLADATVKVESAAKDMDTVAAQLSQQLQSAQQQIQEAVTALYAIRPEE